MDKDLWIVALFLGVLLLSAALIVWMFLSLLRSELEDERRQLIVGRASLWAFTAMVGATLIEVIETAAGLSVCAPDSGGSDVCRFPGVVQAQIRRVSGPWKIRSGLCGRSGASPRRIWPGAAASPVRPSMPSKIINMIPPSPWPSVLPGSWRPQWTGCSSRPSDGKKTFRRAQQSGSPRGAALLLVSGSESWEWNYIRTRRSTGVRDRSQAAGRESSRVAGN